MTEFNSEKIIAAQDDEYWFPYHYVSRMPSAGFQQHYIDSWGINYISTIDFMLRQIDKCNPHSLIDIGCGDGRFTREIGIRFPLMNLKGVDYSLRAIALAKAMNQDMPDLRYEQVDVTKVNFINKYDVAILMEVFEHIPLDEANEFLAGVRNTLNEGGILLLTVPHSNKPVEYKHFQHFTIESIKSFLSPYFEVVEIIPFEKKGFMRILLNKILCNRLFILNNSRLLNFLYRFHLQYLFMCSSERECQRIFVKAIAKKT